MLLANFNGKEHLRHRAVSLRQNGFLVVSALAYADEIVLVAPSASAMRSLLHAMTLLQITVSHLTQPNLKESSYPHTLAVKCNIVSL